MRRGGMRPYATALAAAGALALALLVPAASAQVAPPPDTQALVVTPPPSFKVAVRRGQPDGAMQMTEMVPDGQTLEDWQEMITIQHFPNMRDVDPTALAGRWTQRFISECPKAEAARLPQNPVSGWPAVRVYIHTTDCGPAPAESVLALIVAGRDGLHMVQHAWRPRPPSHAELGSTMASFDQARLCETGHPDCPR